MSQFFRNNRWLVVVIAALGGLQGCGQASRVPPLPPLHPVSGSVKYRGQPAAAFRVTFHPLTDIGPTKYHPSAVTDGAGNFQVTALKPNDGAPQGEYAVTFEWPDHFNQPADPDPVPEIDKLRGVYNRPEQSRFKIRVNVGENALPPFELN